MRLVNGGRLSIEGMKVRGREEERREADVTSTKVKLCCREFRIKMPTLTSVHVRAGAQNSHFLNVYRDSATGGN